MKKQLEQLQEFHNAFLDGNEQIPTLVDERTTNLRYKLLEEENKEYLKACSDGNLVEIADALGDKLYIILGTICKHGMANVIEEVFDRIHKSNMSKLDENGKPVVNGQNGVYDENQPVGKFLKSTRYQRVNLTDLFPDK